MSFNPFILSPVPAPDHIPREDVHIPSSPLRSVAPPNVPNSPSVASDSIKSSTRKRMRDIFKAHSKSPRNSGSAQSMEEDSLKNDRGVPSSPTRLSAARSHYSVPASPEFEALLESVVHGITTDYVSGARQMASSALSNLATLIEFAASTAHSGEELWNLSVSAAQKMAIARPSMSAAVEACLLRALSSIEGTWRTEMEKDYKLPTELARIAGSVVQEILSERQEAGKNLGKSFTYWVKSCGPKVGIYPSHSLYTFPISILPLDQDIP